MQDLAGRCAGRNREDAINLLHGLKALRSMVALRVCSQAEQAHKLQVVEAQLAAALSEQASLQSAVEELQARSDLNRHLCAPCLRVAGVGEQNV